MIFFYALLNVGTNQLNYPSKNDNILFILSFFGLFVHRLQIKRYIFYKNLYVKNCINNQIPGSIKKPGI